MLNDEVFASISMEILDDLTYVSLTDNPFKGPEFSLENAIKELATMLKNEHGELLSEVSIQDFVEAFRDITKSYKIKVYDNKTSNFQ